MKMKKLFMGIMGALALTACSSEEVIPDKPVNNDNGESRFMTVSIRNANSGTRADGDFENGIAEENKLKNIVFFFFNKDGEAINVINGNKNYFVCEGKDEEDNTGKEDIPGNPPTDKDGNPIVNDNVEKLLNATIVLSNGNGNKDNIKDLYSMVAILNYDEVFTTLANKNLADLKGIISDYAKNLTTEKTYTYDIIKETENGTKVTETKKQKFENIPAPYNEKSVLPYLVMTSSSFVAEETDENQVTKKAPTLEVKDIAKHVHETEEKAKADAVKMYVERVVAKVRLKTDWESIIPVTGVTFDDKDNCTAIPLKDKDGNEIKFEDKQIYTIFENWGLTGTAPESYLFKKIDDWKLEGWGSDGKGWNASSYNRSYWAQNPSSVTNGTLHHFPYVATEGNIGTDWFYCLENAANNDDGTKSTYNPNSEITNRTQVFIKARLVTLSDDKTATPLDLAVWGASKYTTSQLIPVMLNQVKNEIFIRKVEKRETDSDGKEHIYYSYISLPENMVTLITGTESKLWDDKEENDKRYISYLSLKKISDVPENKNLVFPENYEHAFFKDVNGNRIGNFAEGDTEKVKLEKDIEEINKIFLSNVIAGEVWEGGKTYYYTDIKHLGLNEKTGEFGVVRNHLYEVIIKDISGLGTPVLNPSDGSQEIIIPQKPTPTSFFLATQVNILSWRIVNQNVSLDW